MFFFLYEEGQAGSLEDEFVNYFHDLEASYLFGFIKIVFQDRCQSEWLLLEFLSEVKDFDFFTNFQRGKLGTDCIFGRTIVDCT